MEQATPCPYLVLEQVKCWVPSPAESQGSSLSLVSLLRVQGCPIPAPPLHKPGINQP